MSATQGDATWPDVPLGGVTQVRVHGVGGTPPGDMMADPHPVQVSGDRTAGFWRGTEDDDAGGRVCVEAYSWGGLTARRVLGALWVLVLPLALANLAGWMAPNRDARAFRGLVRLSGLLLTALYVGFACVLAMDMVAYQCAGAEHRGRSCTAASWWLIGEGGSAHDPVRRVALSAVVPLLVLGVLGWLARRTRQAYEDFGPDAGSSRVTSATVRRLAEAGLAHPSFWKGQGYAAHLAQVHWAVGTGIVAFLVASTMASFVEGWVPPVLVGAATLLLLVCGALALAGLPRKAGWLLPVASVVLVVLTLGLAASSPAPEAHIEGSTVLPGRIALFNPLIAMTMLVGPALFLVALAPLVTSLWRRLRAWVGRRRPGSGLDARRALRQAATPAAVVVLAAMLTLTFLSGATLWAAARLGEARAYRDGAETPAIEYAQAFEVLARALPLVIALFVLVTFAVLVSAGRSVARAGMRRAVNGWSRVTSPEGWSDASELAWWRRRVKRAVRLPVASLAALEWALWVTSTVAVIAAVAYGTLWLQERERRGAGAEHIEVDVGWLEVVPLGLCTWLLTVVIPLGAVTLLSRALTRSSVRRIVAISWDVITFWPRSFHPLAPPPYTERVIPELQARLTRLRQDERGAVLLLGHSQGAVLALAAVASLDSEQSPQAVNRLSVVTYGNPVTRLYARHLPAYVNPELRDLVVARVRLTDHLGWLNFYRDTDYIGHTLGGPDDASSRLHLLDHYLPDPPHPFFPPGDPAPPVRRHSERGYRQQAAFRAHVAKEMSRLNLAPGRAPGSEEPR